MVNRSFRLMLATFVAALSARAAGPSTIVIGGPTSSLMPASGGYSWDGGNLTAYRAALANTSNFGPSGTVTKTVNTVNLSSITAGTLAGVNVFVSPWWAVADSTSFHSVVQSYFLSGGSLILLDDSSGRDGIGALLGIPTAGQENSSWTASGSLLNPFGSPGSISSSGEVGFFSAAAIASHGGTVCATNASALPTAACFAAGAYAPGAGAMIIVADIDTWMTLSTFTPPNNNGKFALNGTAFIVGQAGTVGSPAPPAPPAGPTSVGAPTLSEWGIIILAILLVGVGALRLARPSPEQAG